LEVSDLISFVSFVFAQQDIQSPSRDGFKVAFCEQPVCIGIGWKYLKNRMGDVGLAAPLRAVKQPRDIFAHFLRSGSDFTRGVVHCNFQVIGRHGSLKATTRVVAEIQGRLPEQLERGITTLEKYPTETSIEQTSKEAMARPSQLGEVH
jgi:hypothetical protein